MRRKNMARKNLLRTIRRSLGRYIAIVGIIALGAALFVGLVSTKGDMIATGRKYMEQTQLFDLRLLSTYGWTQKEVDAVAKMPGVEKAEGQISLDALAIIGGGEHNAVYKLHSIPASINQLQLIEGRMPANPNECLVDGQHAPKNLIGTTLYISDTNDESILDSLEYHSYTIVGYVGTPLYMDMTRGSTSLGNGTVTGYIYLPEEAFSMGVYTEIAVRLEGDLLAYTDAYDTFVQEMADQLQPGVSLQAVGRFDMLKAEAEDAYQQGYEEYQSGLADYEKGKADALQQLAEGLQKLEDAQAEIDENRKILDDGFAQLAEAQALLDEQRALLEAGRIELEQGKIEAYNAFAAAYAELMANRKIVRENLALVNDGIAQIDAGLIQIDDGIVQIKDGLQQLEEGLQMLELMISLEQARVDALNILLENAQGALVQDPMLIQRLTDELQKATESLGGYVTQRQELLGTQTELTGTLTGLEQQRQELVQQRQTLVDTKKTLEDALIAIDDGFVELENTQKQTENQFAAAEAEIRSGELQLQQAQKQLDEKLAEAQAGLLALDAAQAELDKGYAEYEEGKLTVERELADAKAKLAKAAAQLADARNTIDSMAPAEVFILDRNTNAGYVALNNNSDIVAGVSRVFPAFFLLVAALVCITTMTRMVEEERTQIGTFKALGYGSGAIVRKYLLYAGSAAILGCGAGTLIGSAVFPSILWHVYQIIIFVPTSVELLVDWPLCLAVVGAYTAVVLLVTWYCCHKSLKEVPAELIRPKAPTLGKKIWMEYLPFWKRFSFLNKVMLRNVFRYRQRMLMMLVGIGGCTALLLTGFGLRDSIVNMVPDQFGNVTTYDMQVYFSKGQSPQAQADFLESLRSHGVTGHFYYQTSMTMQYEHVGKELNVLVTDEGMEPYMHFVQDGVDLGMPNHGEAFLSIGIAEQMGIQVGDTVQIRDSQMRTMDLKIAGIFHNNVYNYIVITPETMESQWGNVPLPQMAVTSVGPSGDSFEASTHIAQLQDVINVMVTDETAEVLDGMLGALDTIVVVVVICAGALAVIVLYNLTNINITERIREIATIKVLGFRASESASYVFKENLLLTVFGMIVGLFLGNWLLDFVISQIKVDIVWLTSNISIWSCVISMGLTVLSALVVDFLLYFKLEKINMAEALKSVE